MEKDTDKSQSGEFTRFNPAIHAVVNGRAVRLLGFKVGDHYLTVDGNGDSGWQSFDNVQIVDTNCLPISGTALSRISKAQEHTSAAGTAPGTMPGSASSRR